MKKKKAYEKPAMRVYKLREPARLLVDSGGEHPNYTPRGW